MTRKNHSPTQLVLLGRHAVMDLVAIAERRMAPDRNLALDAGNLLRKLKQQDLLWQVFSIPGWEVASIGGFLMQLMHDVEAAIHA